MRVMFDANVVLDVLQQREPHQIHSAHLLSRALDGEFEGFIAAHAVTTVFYVLRKSARNDEARKTVSWLIKAFQVTKCDSDVLAEAAESEFSDFEDGVVAFSALRAGCDWIATRNAPDFKHSKVSGVTPEALLMILG